MTLDPAGELELTGKLKLTSGAVSRDGEDIYWELASVGSDDDRPVVVLSHGAGGSHAVWYQQVPVLGQDFRVLCWDSRGFGNSTNRNDAPSAEAAGLDLAAVLDACDVEAAHLVGQSMGGWHISAFAAVHADRVLSLTYADTVGGLWTPALREAFAEFSAAGGLGRGGPTVVGHHPALWSGTAKRDPAHAFLYQQLGSFHSPPMHKIGVTIDWTVSHERIAALGRPVLFVAGTHDGLFPAELLAESSRLIPGAQYVEIPDAGHSPYFEQPAAWNEAVGTFLRAV
jgi:pimeloyl-ACP methyl ester carboxylesterase